MTEDGAAERDLRDLLEAIDDTSGALCGMYTRDYLRELRMDWPE